jgi:hypothetical protein
MPQSPRMHTVERLRRKGDVLTIETTHVDPANYRTPVVTMIRCRATDWELMEYGCTPGGNAGRSQTGGRLVERTVEG